MIYLMNSAVMPSGNYGTFRYGPATLQDLQRVVEGEHGPVVSCIGYPQTADLIYNWTGYRPQVNRNNTFFKPGDCAFVVRMKHRVEDPKTKGAPVGEALDDWELAWVLFLEA